MSAKVIGLLSLLVLAACVGLSNASLESVSDDIADEVFAGLYFEAGSHNWVENTPDGLRLVDGSNSGSYTSPVIEAPLSFSAVVPQWQADVPDTAEVDILLRTRKEGGEWSEWYHTHQQNDWMLPEDTEIVGEMVTASAEDVTHDYAQFAVNMRRDDPQSQPLFRQMRLTFIDASEGPTADELVAQQQSLEQLQPESAEGGYPKPSVVSRQVWCTDPACNYSDGLRYEPVTHLILHHTVTSSSGDYAAVVRAIWQFHTFTRGWGDIGYNYLVDPNGVIYEGHLGGDDVVGTHAAGANAGSMAVSLIGNYVDVVPSPAMLDSAASMFAWKADQKDIDVYDASGMPDLDWGLPNLMGHRDVYGTTQCPGEEAHKLLPWLRDEVAKRIGFVSPYIYIDELSGAFTKSDAGWKTADYGCGFNRHAYYTWSTTDPSQSANWGEWRLPDVGSGTYQIQVYAPYCKTGRSETDGAKYTITHAGGKDNVTVSHEDNVGNWMDLGTFNFAAGDRGKVRLTDLATDDGLGVWFDAIRLRVSGPPPDPPDVTNQRPHSGDWLGQRQVTFNWSLDGSTAVSSSQLEFATDAGFNDIIRSVTIPGATTSHTETFDRDYDRLYWRVVVSTLYNQTSVSPITSFGIDTVPPTSEVEAIYLLEDGTYSVHWSGFDDTSGLAGYTVEYKAAGPSSWTRWFTDTPITGSVFVPPDGQVYQFRSQATDLANNEEAPNESGDRSTLQAIQLFREMIFPAFVN